MKKKEIISLIDLNKQILQSKKYESIVLPTFNELKDEIEILKTEIDEGRRTADEALNNIKQYDCDHSVRLDYPSFFGFFHSYTDCVLCGNSIKKDSINNSNTIYEDTNRNRYCVL